MRVAVIGAGCAGLGAAKHSLEAGMEVVVYEQTDQLGGTWVYRDEIGKDQFGLDIHSSMYRGLKTNRPREIIGYPDLPMTEGDGSFVSSEDVLKYFNRYADFFNLRLAKTYPEIAGLTEYGALFSDGTEDKFTMIIYCTGYRYSFPFLSSECGISVTDYVAPLYKHCININHPTMAFIGLCQAVLTAPIIDVQVRFVLQFLTSSNDLPLREEMLASEKRELLKRLEVGLCLRKAHSMGPYMEEYVEDLAAIAGIQSVPRVVFAINNATGELTKELKMGFRSFNFKIIDRNTFEKSKAL